MASITLELSDSQLQKLQDLAALYGVPLEVLLKIGLDDWLNARTSEFVESSGYVLQKNAELYRRLA
ncbi:MAG: DNA-binding protein [Cyanobacteria bacterium J06638_22]